MVQSHGQLRFGDEGRDLQSHHVQVVHAELR